MSAAYLALAITLGIAALIELVSLVAIAWCLFKGDEEETGL
jgi:hypothetical protein